MSTAAVTIKGRPTVSAASVQAVVTTKATMTKKNDNESYNDRDRDKDNALTNDNNRADDRNSINSIIDVVAVAPVVDDVIVETVKNTLLTSGFLYMMLLMLLWMIYLLDYTSTKKKK